MATLNDDSLPRGCKMIELPFIEDQRGCLSFAEAGKHIPFQIKRVFWTYHVQNDNQRGDHAHRTCQMVLFPLGGSFELELDDGEHTKVILMDNPSRGVLIPPLVWCKLTHFSPAAACVSLASEPYVAEDYIHDYEEFLSLTRK